MKRQRNTSGARRLLPAGLLAASVLVITGAPGAMAGLLGGTLPATGFTFVSTTDTGVNIRGGGIQLASRGPMDVKSTYSKIAPTGALLGWHHHNGPVLVSVTVGTLTFVDENCATWDVTAGETYVESPQQVLNAYADPAKNAGLGSVEWLTTRMYPAGVTDPVPDPAPCALE
jgi:hypothetical protein